MCALKRPRCGAVVQGNIRPGTVACLVELRKHFEVVILSTWDDEVLPAVQLAGLSVVQSQRPAHVGVTNRNLQRLSSAAGIARAEELGCEYVLKWRTDMVPTALSLERLMAWARADVPPLLPSRLLMSPFRQLSVQPDWFSSFPDFYAFGHVSLLKMLWQVKGFDYSAPFNVPLGMRRQTGLTVADGQIRLDGADVTICYDAHAECYAWFRENLQQATGAEWRHGEIVRTCLALPRHTRWRICWFGRDQFRSISQAMAVNWLTEERWKRHDLPPPVPVEMLRSHERKGLFPRLKNIFAIKAEIMLQRYWWRAFCRRNGSALRAAAAA
jgi:hypothetical protein